MYLKTKRIRLFFLLIVSIAAITHQFQIYAQNKSNQSQTQSATQVNSSETTKEETIFAIDKYLNDQENAGFSGVVLLAKDNEIILSKTYGLANRERNYHSTLKTGYDLGSIVKLFTAAAVFKLESQGKLKTTDNLSKFFKDVPLDKAGITIDQILNHIAGLPDLVDKNSNPLPENDSGTDFNLDRVSRDELVKRTLNAKLLFSPGQKFEYSNLGYSFLAAVIEVASGQSYEKYLRKEIFKPANMKKTGYLLSDWKKKDLAIGYQKDKPVGTPLDYSNLTDGRHGYCADRAE